jgi:hypothetical protein
MPPHRTACTRARRTVSSITHRASHAAPRSLAVAHSASPRWHARRRAGCGTLYTRTGVDRLTPFAGQSIVGLYACAPVDGHALMYMSFECRLDVCMRCGGVVRTPRDELPHRYRPAQLRPSSRVGGRCGSAIDRHRPDRIGPASHGVKANREVRVWCVRIGHAAPSVARVTRSETTSRDRRPDDSTGRGHRETGGYGTGRRMHRTHVAMSVWCPSMHCQLAHFAH